METVRKACLKFFASRKDRNQPALKEREFKWYRIEKKQKICTQIVQTFLEYIIYFFGTWNERDLFVKIIWFINYNFRMSYYYFQNFFFFQSSTAKCGQLISLAFFNKIFSLITHFGIDVCSKRPMKLSFYSIEFVCPGIVWLQINLSNLFDVVGIVWIVQMLVKSKK